MLSKYLKILSLLVLLNVSLYSSDFLYIDPSDGNHYCIYEYNVLNDSSGVEIHLCSDDQNYSLSINPETSIFPGYKYNSSDNTCNKEIDWFSLGLTYHSYHYLLSFSGLLIGFLFLFFGVYIVILVSKK